MRPRIRFEAIAAACVLAATSAVAFAQGAPPAAPWTPMPLGDVQRCLKQLNLQTAQQDAIAQFLDSEKTAVQALHDQLAVDARTLQADTAATTPNPATVGADYLKVQGDRQAIGAERQKVIDFVAGQLTADQKARFLGCTDHASIGRGRFSGAR